jgi:hypothetical protein
LVTAAGKEREPRNDNLDTDRGIAMTRLALFIPLSLYLLQGCGRGLDKDADPEEGVRALHTALAAWKDGKPPAELEKLTPPIIMNEDDWRLGKRLLDFKVVESGLAGRQIRCRVQIKLGGKQGKSFEQRATYIIDTNPRLVIVRDTFAS